MAGNQQEATTETKMLKKGIGHGKPLRRLRRPELVGEEGRRQGEASKCQGRKPTPDADQDQQRRAELEGDGGDGDRSRRRQAKVTHFRKRHIEIQGLGQTALQIGAAESERRKPIQSRYTQNSGWESAHQTAQQAQPSAPQKLLRSRIGKRLDQAVA